MAVSATGGADSFNAKVIIWLVGGAIAAFIAYLFLSTYAPEMNEGSDGGGHALSKSAIGYSAFVKLETELGRAPMLVRDEDDLKTDGLLILTPPAGQDSDELAKLVAARDGKPTLIILPKHQVDRLLFNSAWVRDSGLYPVEDLSRIVNRLASITVERMRTTASASFGHPTPVVIFNDTRDVQTYRADEMVPIFTDDLHPDNLRANNYIIARASNNVFILSDPDLLNNIGMNDPHRAFGAVRLIEGMIPYKNQRIMFDVTLNGFKQGRDLVDLLLRPPFLAFTIALIIAAILALVNGLVRFGPALAEARAIPRGKGALVANTADMLKLARVEHELGGRYVALIRELAARQFGLPQTISRAAATARFDALSKDGPTFSSLADQAEHAGDRATLVGAAQKLDQWRRSKT
jgi:hypothetical protein